MNNFIFYSNWLESIEKLGEAQQCELLKAIVEYGCTGKRRECGDAAVAAVFNMICPQIDSAQAKY